VLNLKSGYQYKKAQITCASFKFLISGFKVKAQDDQWIRRDSTVWGIRGGIVVGLWPVLLRIGNLAQPEAPGDCCG